MAKATSPNGRCSITKKLLPRDQLVPLDQIRPKIARLIQHAHPALQPVDLISLTEVNRYRLDYVQQVLEAELGQISVLESELLDSLREHELSATNVNQEFDRKLTWGEHLADRIAAFGGSWTFIGLFGFFLLGWVAANTALLTKPLDPYPFILLNLFLSCIAAVQAPIILMSQNRLEAKDRLRADEEYKVNMKAELEIRLLHEKIDHLLKDQAQRLFELQHIQLEFMKELAEIRKSPEPQRLPTTPKKSETPVSAV